MRVRGCERSSSAMSAARHPAPLAHPAGSRVRASGTGIYMRAQEKCRLGGQKGGKISGWLTNVSRQWRLSRLPHGCTAARSTRLHDATLLLCVTRSTSGCSPAGPMTRDRKLGIFKDHARLAKIAAQASKAVGE